MSVKRPGSAFSSGAESLEPLDSRDLQKSVKSGAFASQLEALETAAGAESAGETESPTMQGLRQIAAGADFSTKEKSLAVIRESARLMINSRIQEKFRENEKVSDMVEELSDFVSSDPFLNKKLEKILQRLKKD